MAKPKLKQRADGRYKCKFQGKQFYGRTMQEAMQKRDDYKAAVKRGMNPTNITVESFASSWLPDAKSEVSVKTYNDNANFLEKLCTVIGEKRLIDVKPSDIKKVYSRKFSGMSDSYIKHAKCAYVSMFDAAVSDGLILTNPCRKVKPHTGTEGSHRAITPIERGWIETLAVNHRVHPLAMLMLYAGLRPAEAIPIRAEDLDFEHNIIRIRSFWRADGSNQRMATPTGKTKKSVRNVPMVSILRDALLPFRERSGLIITDEDGGILSETAWRRAWESYKCKMETAINGVSPRWYGKTKIQKAMLASGTLPDWVPFTVVPYDLRHSFVTWCRDNGIELHTVMEWCGHTDPTMILKIYDEVSDTRVKGEVAELEKALNK